MDVGGESTRPGSEGVSVDEELRRVVPVLERLGGDVPLSIDTSKAEVARRALELGAELVNDVTALRGDPDMAEVVAEVGCLRLPHAHARRAADDAGRPSLRRRRIGRQGVSRGAACVRGRCGDRGGTDLRRSGHRLRQDGRAQRRAVAPARRARRARAACARRRVAQALPRPAARRARGDGGADAASVAAAVVAVAAGATIVRVHDVRETVEALQVVKIELHGVEVFGYHGATEVEEREGQMFLFDVVALAAAASRTRTTSSSTIDYREVATCVREVSDRRAGPACSRRSPARHRRRADSALSPSSASASACGSRTSSSTRRPSTRPSRSSGRDARIRRARRESRRPRADDPRGGRGAIGARRLSEIRETEPWGYADQPPFLNAVAEVDTELCAARAARLPARGRARPRPRARHGAALRPAARSTSTSCSSGADVDRRARADRAASSSPRAPLRARAARRARPGLVVPGRGTVAELLAALD